MKPNDVLFPGPPKTPRRSVLDCCSDAADAADAAAVAAATDLISRRLIINRSSLPVIVQLLNEHSLLSQ
ncbi:unnamed protein product [Heligmosomoides polygyrus]|uniref:Uncharacterized protein n=1 Tax=Heligmosomoides polygyrus TaxID=6339 RepID=A0A183FUX5_HELPZ|nr:unnamed protein product [Heligmosomoides polygyrus]